MKKKWKSSDAQKLRELIASGKSVDEMAQHFGVSAMSVRMATYRYTFGLRSIRSQNGHELSITGVQ